MSIKLYTNDYIVLRNFIPKERAQALSDAFSKHIDNGGTFGYDPQAPTSPAVYNFKPFLSETLYSLPKMEEIAGEQLFPTYCYARRYVNGADLKKHKDRPACEISVTVCLEKDTDWRFFITDGQSGMPAEIELEQGDAVAYLGEQAEHWRLGYGGKAHTQLFMHYVRAYGPNSWAYFDRFNSDPRGTPGEVFLTK